MSPSEHQELISSVGGRFAMIDHRVQMIDHRVQMIGDRFQLIAHRFDATERELGELCAEILRHVDALGRRAEPLEPEHAAIPQALQWIEAVLADDRSRRTRLERDRAVLRENVALLQARIEAMEGRLPPVPRHASAITHLPRPRRIVAWSKRPEPLVV
jgi:chromosome segregation ATPase